MTAAPSKRVVVARAGKEEIVFAQQLFGAWCVAGLDASPRDDGSITFCCPVCADPTRLAVAPGAVSCSKCGWQANGGARELTAEAVKVRTAASITQKEGSRALEKRRFDVKNPPPEEPVVYAIGGTPICHAGNITTIEAHQKSGKSSFVAAAIASTFSREGADCLGWKSENPHGRAVLHFDTEQSRGDHHRLMCSALVRAGATEPPAWLDSYCITGFGCAEMREAITARIAAAKVSFEGVHSLILDGVADPVNDVNDPAESFEFVAWLQSIAIDGGFPIIGILHLNPGDSGKSRGHLGSQLNRKSEHVLRLSRDGETSTVKSQWSRRAPIPADGEPAFAWNMGAARHVSVACASRVKSDSKRDALASLAAECFRDSAGIGLSWAQLHTEIQALDGASLATARRRFDAMKAARIIHQRGEKYHLS